jgi:regulator of cell morphogenesis and NO signaling
MNATPASPVGALVAERLGRARVFDRLGIDYCCHGATPLAEACALRSLDVGKVLSEVAASDLSGADDEADRVDYTAISPGALTDLIVLTHHAYLRHELPRLAHLIDRVAAAHAGTHPELDELRETFAGLRQELEMHMIKEEWVLFPLIKQLEAARAPFPIHCGSVGNPILVMEHEHATAGAALARIRRLTGDYQVPSDGCTSYRALYDGFDRLEQDLHRHIHKENNILFPRAAEREAALGCLACSQPDARDDV